jgi:hypothetical protein
MEAARPDTTVSTDAVSVAIEVAISDSIDRAVSASPEKTGNGAPSETSVSSGGRRA